MMETCPFCRIVRGEEDAAVVFADDVSLAFLDRYPLFLGHCLLTPKLHWETLYDLPADVAARLMINAQLLARAVEKGMAADGTFIAVNNRVSQSVPHVHIHIVPRRRGDGLKGFFWPRLHHVPSSEVLAARDAIRAALLELQGGPRTEEHG